jgi:outer membrane protein assembly factor BamB
VGGRKGGIVALDAKSGETKFAASTEAASYSSPTLLDEHATSAVMITRLNVMRVDLKAKEAESLFRFGSLGPTVNAAMPLVIGDRLFVTASYGVGAACYDLSGNEPKQIWADDDSISSQYSTPVHRDGHLYGVHGREDIPPAHLRCVELATGKVKWSSDDFGVAHVIVAGNNLLLLKVDGELVLAEATPREFKELDRARIARGVTRALPALADGLFYCRTGEKLICLQLAD